MRDWYGTGAIVPRPRNPLVQLGFMPGDVIVVTDQYTYNLYRPTMLPSGHAVKPIMLTDEEREDLYNAAAAYYPGGFGGSVSRTRRAQRKLDPEAYDEDYRDEDHS